MNGMVTQHGGSILKRGPSGAVVTATATTIVTAAANVNGVLVHTFANNGTGASQILIGLTPHAIAVLELGGTVPASFFIPAGEKIDVIAAVGTSATVTYEVL